MGMRLKWSWKLLVVIGVLVYLPVLKNGFVWDDFHFIVENRIVGDPRQWGRLFVTNSTAGAGLVDSYYRPITSLSWGVDLVVWGADNPWGLHLVSVLIHAAAGVGLFGLLKLMGLPARVAWWMAVVFLVHPTSVQAVAFIAARGEMLYTLLLLGSLVEFGESIKTQNSKLKIQNIKLKKIWQLLIGTRRGKLSLSIGLFVLALLSKDTAIAGAGLYPLVWWAVNGWEIELLRLKKLLVATKEQVITWLVVCAMAMVYLGLRLTVLAFSGTTHLPEIYLNSVWVRLFTFARIFWEYLELFFWPTRLYFERMSEILAGPSVWLLGIVILVIALFWGGLVERRKYGSGFLWAGLWWLVISLVPISGVIVTNGLWFDHWLYMPMVGIMLIVYGLGQIAYRKLLIKKIDEKVLVVMMGLIGFGLSVKTVNQIGVWKDNVSVFSYNIEQSPTARLYNNLGLEYIRQGELDKAKKALDEAERMDPGLVQVYFNRGLLAEKRGDLQGIEAGFLKALELRPDYYLARQQLIKQYAIYGVYDKALEHTEVLIGQVPDNWRLRVMKGRVEWLAGKHGRAEEDFAMGVEMAGDKIEAEATVETIRGGGLRVEQGWGLW